MNNSVLADSLRPLAARSLRVVGEREILRIAGTICGGDRDKTANAARQEVLTWAENRSGARFPAEAWDHHDFEHLALGRNCIAVRIVDEEMDFWAIRSDDPDKTVAQRIWTNEVVIGGRADQRPLFSARLLIGTPEAEIDINPHVPGFVQQIVDTSGLTQKGSFLESEPRLVRSSEAGEQLLDILVDRERDLPVLVLTVPEFAADPLQPLLDARELARATLGIAMVYVLPAEFTWLLTQRFGKKLSVFGGAVRIYLPGFDEDSRPYSGHELVIADRIASPSAAAACGKWLRKIAAAESVRRFRLGKDVLAFSSIRQAGLEFRRGRLEKAGATDSALLRAARIQIGALKEAVQKAQDAEQWLSDEHAAAEEHARIAEAQSRDYAFRIQQLTDRIRERGEDPDANVALPENWSTFVEWCDERLAGLVTLSQRARKELRQPQFDDPQMAARSLKWLANEYRARRLHGGDGALHGSAIEAGLKNERCGTDAFEIDWAGSRHEVDWHIKNGGNTRYPSRCLRIYYFWDDASQQVVIASMPAHVRSGAT